MQTFIRNPIILTGLVILGCFFSTSAQPGSTLIINATLIDGSGSPPLYNQQLLIRDGKIAAIGTALEQSADRVIDAAGRVVCPGFIDPHAHGDPLGKSNFENFLAMGVTTILLGQDGSGVQPDKLTGWFTQIESRQAHLNIATLIGHGTLRRLANVPDTLPANETQFAEMQQLLAAAIRHGAFGMSTGLEYVPGLFAGEAELLALAKTVDAAGGLIMSHMREEDDDKLDAAIDELLRQGAYCRVHISHLKAVYGKDAARGREVLQKIRRARESGIRISADVYPYIASYTGIGIVFPPWAKTGDSFAASLENRPEELKEYLFKRVMKRNGPEATLFGTGSLAGRTLAQVAADSGKSFVELLLQIGPGGASGAYFVMNQQLQDIFITAPDIALCTDGSPGMRHPRGYGSYSKLIEEYVVQRELLDLQTAIHKATALPAAIIGLHDRGLLKEGLAADILIFDPQKIHSRTTWSNPYQLAEGFDMVIVNGELARLSTGAFKQGEQGVLTNARAGRVLRKNRL